jgi:hypothetical protein
MTRLAIYTFGILRSDWEAAETASFQSATLEVFGEARASDGYIDHAGTARPDLKGKPALGHDFGAWGTYVLPRFYEGSLEPDKLTAIATLSLWRDIDSVRNFVYQGVHHRDALKRRYDWFVKGRWPGLVLWWIDDAETPTWAQGTAKLELLHDTGASPAAFSFNERFGPHERR